MVALDINHAVVGTSNTNLYSDHTSSETDFYNGSVLNTDGITGYETSYTPNFATWHGYYEDVSIFGALIDILANWTIGRGIEGKDWNKIKNVKGFGKDDPNSIFENLLRTALICGDSFAEIVRDKAGRITNLKPLSPQNVKIVANANGIIKHYEITNINDPFEPNRIFHLCWNRLADEIHGKSLAKRAEPIIKQIKQLQEDFGIRFHRIVKPLRLYKAKTDDETSLTSVEAKLNEGYTKCEIIVIPEGTLEPTQAENIPNAEDAIKYMNVLIRNFVSACNCPEVIIGWSEGTTDASAKIVYLSFQQPTERKQKFLEEQIRLQLGLELNCIFPASLEPVMQTAGDKGSTPIEKPPINNPPSKDDTKKGSQLKK